MKKTITKFTKELSTFPPPITAARSRDLPGTFTAPQSRRAIFARIEEARDLGYMPAPYFRSRARDELFKEWKRVCYLEKIPIVAICRRPRPRYGGYMMYKLPVSQCKNWNYAGLSRVLYEELFAL